MIDPRVIELIHAALDGELDPADEAELEKHLAESPEARHYQEQMSELCAFLDKAPPLELPDGVRNGILDGVKLPAAKPAKAAFGLGRIPAFARYGLAAAAGLVLAIGIYEFRPGGDAEPDFSSMAGTILPGDVVLDQYSFESEQLSSSVSLRRRDDALVLDVELDSAAPFDITVDFTSDGLRFDAISQLDSDLSSIEVADRSIQVKGRGRQHFAVLLQREGAAGGSAARIRLDYSSDGKLLNSGELVTK